VSTVDASEFRQRIQEIETLIHEVERFADPAAQAHTRALVQALLDIHGAGLARLLDHVELGGTHGRSIIDALARDSLVSSLLVLHGLHPLDLETRVRQALDHVRPYLRSHGGDVELVDVVEGAVRIRMQGHCHDCPSSAKTLEQAIAAAIDEAAPDATAILVEDAPAPPTRAGAAFVPVELLAGANGRDRMEGRGDP
jgi:Fe-S cluster biogenesis protein NfuA